MCGYFHSCFSLLFFIYIYFWVTDHDAYKDMLVPAELELQKRSRENNRKIIMEEKWQQFCMKSHQKPGINELESALDKMAPCSVLAADSAVLHLTGTEQSHSSCGASKPVHPTRHVSANSH